MNKKTVILLSIMVITIVLMGAVYFLLPQLKQLATPVSVSTDKQVYRVGDTVHVTIRNLGNRSVDIYCPMFCALGNFPTTVEHFSKGQWQYLGGFCPSIEPLFGKRAGDKNYIRHTLSAKESFELDIDNFEHLHVEPGQKLRIVYYLSGIKKPIYSNEFTFQSSVIYSLDGFAKWVRISDKPQDRTRGI